MGLKHPLFGRLRLRQPEYTGRNRCVPCTIVNVAIGIGLSLGLALWSRPVAVTVGGVALAAVYLRGYLIPGTPALTKRYLPTWLSTRFGKAQSTFAAETDPGSTLLEVGLLRPTPGGSDIRLDPGFAARWTARTGEFLDSDREDEAAALAAVLDLPIEDVLVAQGETIVSAHLDGQFLGSWPSLTAFLADLAGSELLAPVIPGWAESTSRRRIELVSTLRLFTESCPRCGGAVDLDEEHRATCCSTYEIVTADCRDCGTRLIELPLSEAMRDAMLDRTT